MAHRAAEGADTARRLTEWLQAEPLRLRVLEAVRASGVPTYIVGGTVRDALLGRQSHDLDLAVAGDAIGLARRVADAVGVAFVPLDREHDVARAVARGAAGEERFDFAGLRGADIDADLRARDFTINAMAVPAAGNWDHLMDPTGGRDDLMAGMLRAAYPHAFVDDPVRVLRGVRLRGSLGLAVDPDTEAAMRAAGDLLARISPERIRDELLQIVALPVAGEMWRYAAALGALAVAMPALDGDEMATEAGAGRLTAMAEIEARLAAGDPPELAPYNARVAANLAEPLAGGFSYGALVRLAAACSGLPGGADAAQNVARGLHLSGPAVRLVAQTVRGAGLILARPDETWDVRRVYRYYRDAGAAGGAAGVLLALACRRAEADLVNGVAAAADPVVTSAAALWRAWYDERTLRIDPPSLLNGRDLMDRLGLAPGPEIGAVLEALREAQAVGEVRTREQALDWVAGRRRAADENRG